MKLADETQDEIEDFCANIFRNKHQAKLPVAKT
jgi:hypothetical protein